MQQATPGDVLAGRFELIGKLGAGGLAEVWSARDRCSGARVAVKTLHAHLAGHALVAERFRREMGITRGLDAPGIVRVFDLHEHDGRPFFSMEALQGRTLAEALRGGPLPSREARRIAREICAALAVAHAQGVIHRDLKPQNVFVTEGGGVKLLDFGLAQVAGGVGLTAASAVMGTAGYVAPEVLAGARPDARADLFALGATLFEMLTGRRAFPGSDPFEHARPDLEALLAGCPPLEAGDAAILRRALAADPEQRFLSADQLSRALAGESVPPAPPSPLPLTSGDHDVLVHYALKPALLLRRTKPIDAVLHRLGATASRAWKLRFACAGQAVLIASASGRAAELAVSLCAEHGLPATVRPAAHRPKTEAFVARHAGWLCAAAGAAVGAALAAVFWAGPAPWEIAAAAAAGYALSWGFVSGASRAPVSKLPDSAPLLGRLAAGLAHRADRLRAEVGDLPELNEAGAAVEASLQVARGLQQTGAPRLEQITARLLELGTCLDALLVAGSPDGRSGGCGPLQRSLADLRRALAEA